MTWDSIRGHHQQVDMFRRAAARGRLAHAYLFVGPDGVGKKRFACTLARCLFCRRASEAELQACGECPSCRQMQAGTYPDFLQVGLPEGRSELPIDVFVGSRERRGREGVCYELSLTPTAGRRRIAVIDDVHRMNAESANALLKTLEEPPEHALLILITHQTDALLPTIRSRCQHVRFARLDEADLAELLQELGWVDGRDEAQRVARLSEGSLATAAQLFDPGLRALRDALYSALSATSFDSVALAEEMIAGVEDLGGDGPTRRHNAGWLIRFVIEFFRGSLHEFVGGTTHPEETVRRFAGRLASGTAEDAQCLMEIVDRADLAQRQLDRNTPIPLCLEGLFDDLGRLLRRTPAA